MTIGSRCPLATGLTRLEPLRLGAAVFFPAGSGVGAPGAGARMGPVRLAESPALFPPPGMNFPARLMARGNRLDGFVMQSRCLYTPIGNLLIPEIGLEGKRSKLKPHKNRRNLLADSTRGWISKTQAAVFTVRWQEAEASAWTAATRSAARSVPQYGRRAQAG